MNEHVVMALAVWAIFFAACKVGLAVGGRLLLFLSRCMPYAALIVAAIYCLRFTK